MLIGTVMGTRRMSCGGGFDFFSSSSAESILPCDF